MGQPGATEFLDHVEQFLEFGIPAFAAEGKSRLTIGIGCTGGRHRSIVIAEQLAAWLVEQSAVDRVYYPGLSSHPGHELARRQMRDFGGMISIHLRGGRAAAERFVTRTRVFSLAESLGGVESLVCHPATMTHASIPTDIRHARGIDDALLRLSVGIEDLEDLREDLRQAIA